jgi:hypothetical protein
MKKTKTTKISTPKNKARSAQRRKSMRRVSSDAAAPITRLNMKAAIDSIADRSLKPPRPARQPPAAPA